MKKNSRPVSSCLSSPTGEQTARSQRTSGRARVERRGAIVRLAGPADPAARRAHALDLERASTRCPSSGGLRTQMVAGQSVPGQRWQR